MNAFTSISLTRIKKLQKEVWAVKLADRITNLQPPPSGWNKQKRLKYLEESKSLFYALFKNRFWNHSRKNILKCWIRTVFNLKRNTCLNSLMIFMTGIKYYGALHLWFCFSNAFLQILSSSAAFHLVRKVQIIQISK